MHLRLQNIRTLVTEATEAEQEWLAEFLRFSVGGYMRSDEIPMLRVRAQQASFPSGLLGLVRKKAKQESITIHVTDARIKPRSPSSLEDAGISWLAAHQKTALRAMLESGRGIIRIATGGGKGHILVAASMVIGGVALACCDNYALIDDLANRWERYNPGLRAGRIGNGQWDEGDGLFVSGTWQTLYRRLREGDKRAEALAARVEQVHADECHVTPAKQASTVLTALKNAYWRFGYSGTPLARSDRRSIEAVGHFGSIIITVTASELVDAGFSSECSVRMLTCDLPYMSWEPPAPAYKEQVVRSEARNAVVLEAIRRAERPTLVFFKEKAHGRRLKKLLERSDVRCDLSYGIDSIETRRSKLRWLVREGDAVLLVNKVFEKGEVAPEIAQIRDIVNAAAGKSTIEVLQRLGRGARIDYAPDGTVLKSSFTLWDILDTCSAAPHAALAKQARERRAAYEKAGHKVLID